MPEPENPGEDTPDRQEDGQEDEPSTRRYEDEPADAQEPAEAETEGNGKEAMETTGAPDDTDDANRIPDSVGQQAPTPPDQEEPLRTRVPLWSPIGADTSHVHRPDPEDVDLKKPVLLFLAPIVILALGSLVARDLVWDRFLDKYVWEWIVLDLGFNPVNTGLWALLLGLLLFFSYRLVQRIGQPIDFLIIAATVPYMVGGAFTRVLEDTGYFGEPLRYFFITPIIYVMIFGVAVVWLVVGWLLRRQAGSVGHDGALKSLGGLLGLVWILYFTASHFAADAVSYYPSPWVLLLAFVVPYAYFWNHTKQTGNFSQVGVMATFGSAFMLSALYMLVLWHTGAQWDTMVGCDVKPQPCRPGFGTDQNLWIYPLMIGIVGVFMAVIYLIARRNLFRHENAFVALLPVNLLVIFGQAWDSLSTSVGIDFLGYSEKHWLPGILMGALESSGLPVLSTFAASFVMIPLKVAVAFAVVYLVDVYSRSDMAKYPDLVGLVKLAIIMVGVVPGTRNMMRMAMGV